MPEWEPQRSDQFFVQGVLVAYHDKSLQLRTGRWYLNVARKLCVPLAARFQIGVHLPLRTSPPVVGWVTGLVVRQVWENINDALAFAAERLCNYELSNYPEFYYAHG